MSIDNISCFLTCAGLIRTVQKHRSPERNNASRGSVTFRLYFIRRRWKSKAVRVRELRKSAEDLSQTDPRQAILDIYTALRFSLELAGQERGTLELLDFADRLAAVNRNLSESARIIFLLYYKAEYSSLVLTPADAAKAITLYDSIRYEDD